MEIIKKEIDDIIILSVKSFEIESERDEIKSSLLKYQKDGNKKLIINLSYYNSVPVSMFWSIIIAVHKAYIADGGTVILTGADNSTLEVVESLGLMNVFTVLKDVDRSIEYLNGIKL